MKKLLLIGDSIRMNYQPAVVKNLKNKVSVFAIDENARFAKYTNWYIREWLGTYGTPDVIHWNNGMWDIYRHEPDSKNFTPVEEYARTIEDTYNIMRKVCDKIIFATITNVRAQNPHCTNEEIALYNKAALQVLSGKDIVINDLNAITRGKEDICVCDDYMHLSQQGIELCGAQVSRTVLDVLGIEN